MTEEKTCYNCGNKNCHIFYSTVKQDVAEHHETYEWTDFDCVNHDKWEEMKVEEIRTDNTETLKNALERIKELEREKAELEKENAELEAGKDMNVSTKWHKVADGDLPKDCGDGTHTSKHVWVRFMSGNTGVCYYDWDLLGWFANGYPDEIRHILAWCEIPEYTEE